MWSKLKAWAKSPATDNDVIIAFMAIPPMTLLGIGFLLWAFK